MNSTRKKIQNQWTSRISTINNNQFRLRCAFHVDEKITNFCRNSQCLLPLCPRCVKIHTEQHMRNSTHGDFQIIADCFKYAQDEFTLILRSTKQVSNSSQQLHNLRLINNKKIRQNFLIAKNNFLQTLEVVFEDIQSELDQIIRQDELNFSKQLLAIEDSLSFLINHSKKGLEGLQSPYSLQTLIHFYSQSGESLETTLTQCKNKLIEFQSTLTSIKIDHSQLSNLQNFIKEYIKIITISKNYTPLQSLQKLTISRQRQQKPYLINNNTFNRLSNKIRNSGTGKYFETPLDGFDLNISRERRKGISVKNKI